VTIFERLVSKIEYDTNGGCWLWSGAPNSYGYGQIWLEGRQPLAHRLMYECHAGEKVPKGMFVCHRCDVPACINPAHLFLGTPKDNMADKMKKGRARTPRGERAGRAKLKDVQALAIIRRCAAGETQKSVAADYGVTASAVGDIVRRRNFKHLGLAP
jgi:hypothetical protein